MFLLLVFFLVTASFTSHEGVLASSLPGPGVKSFGDPPPPRVPIEIHVSSVGTSGCRLAIRRHPISPRTFSELSKQLRDMQYNSQAGRRGPFAVDSPVIIQADHHVRWQHVVNAFNAVLRAGYTNVRLGPAAID